ncbi:hypothetical protein F7725_001593 [Dissostichus mawsoni]|uniref:Uncharacterized protein n=1 Tax=Dissostichus mawsoni TaxID=36200 RepID=A0A7J5Y031_DISMA|nr:hypothetical protein F7725_001593 [Dissostichus mawsoni]
MTKPLSHPPPPSSHTTGTGPSGTPPPAVVSPPKAPFISPLIYSEDRRRQRQREREGRYSELGLCFLICYSPVLARASPLWGLRIQTEDTERETLQEESSSIIQGNSLFFHKQVLHLSTQSARALSPGRGSINWLHYRMSVDRSQFQHFHPSVEDMMKAETFFLSSPSHKIDYCISAERLDHVPVLNPPELRDCLNGNIAGKGTAESHSQLPEKCNNTTSIRFGELTMCKHGK